MSDIWFKKHSPVCLADIIGNKSAVTQINKLIKKKCPNILITGNFGIGKKTISTLILKLNNYYHDLFDSYTEKLNTKLDEIYSNYASSYRNRRFYIVDNKKYALVINLTNITNKTYLDEIKNITVKNAENPLFPIILISDVDYTKFLSRLKHCEIFKLKNPVNKEMQCLLDRILKKENMSIGLAKTKTKLINFCQGDVRKLMLTTYDLNSVFGKKKMTKNDIIRYIRNSQRKDREINIFDSTQELTNKYSDFDKIFMVYKKDRVLIPQSLHENYYKGISFAEKRHELKNITIIKNITKSFSMGDTIENYIFMDQKWSLDEVYCHYSCVKPSYYLNKYDNACGYRLTFPKSLGNISIQRINERLINGLSKNLSKIKKTNLPITSKSVNDLLSIQTLLVSLIKKNQYKKIISFLKHYDIDAGVMDKLMRIDKTQKIERNVIFNKLLRGTT